MADEVVTLTVRGGGGDVFDMDLPAKGSQRREIFDDHVSKGWLSVIDGMPEEEAEQEPAELEDLTAAQLKKLAAAEGIDLAGATKKADIVTQIEVARAAAPIEDDDDPEV